MFSLVNGAPTYGHLCWSVKGRGEAHPPPTHTTAGKVAAAGGGGRIIISICWTTSQKEGEEWKGKEAGLAGQWPALGPWDKWLREKKGTQRGRSTTLRLALVLFRMWGKNHLPLFLLDEEEDPTRSWAFLSSSMGPFPLLVPYFFSGAASSYMPPPSHPPSSFSR